jgi:hypothetical protein
MSLEQAFVSFEQNGNTNQLLAAAREAGVTVSDTAILKAAEEAAEGVYDGNGGRRPVRTAPELFAERTKQFVAAVSK